MDLGRIITADAIMFEREPVEVTQGLEEGVGEVGLLQDHVQFERLERCGHVDEGVVGQRRQLVERQAQLAQFARVTEQSGLEPAQLVALQDQHLQIAGPVLKHVKPMSMQHKIIH